MDISVDQGAAMIIAAGYTRQTKEVSYKQGRGGVYEPSNRFTKREGDAVMCIIMDVERDHDPNIRMWQEYHCTHQEYVMFRNHTVESFVEAIHSKEQEIIRHNIGA